MADNPVWKAVKPFMNGGLSGYGRDVRDSADRYRQSSITTRRSGDLSVLPPGSSKTMVLVPFTVCLPVCCVKRRTRRLVLVSTLSSWIPEKTNNGRLYRRAKSRSWFSGRWLGAIFGSPADLSLIRMQADKTLPVDQRRNYTGVVHALSDIVKNEAGLFTGASTTAIRAMALNMGMPLTTKRKRC